MRRRRYLGACASLVGGATAGCLSGFTGDDGPAAPPTVTDRPDAVYVPSHVEGMNMAGTGAAGELKVALSYSFPHRFWLITGTNRKLVEIREQDTVHLMATVWDPETGVVVPTGNVSASVRKGGETVVDKQMWPMLSQNMGVHFGDNVALDGDGTYETEVSVDPVSARTTGAFADRFGAKASTTIEFEFTESKLNEVLFERLDDRAGERDAVDPMEMMPVARAPERSALPGSVVGEAERGDAVLLATMLDAPPEGVDGSGAYLAVSPRTPYNRFPLPFATLSATVIRDGETAFDDHLPSTFDPDLGIHYGATVDELQSDDEVTLSVGAPPQLARHEGYETAFLEMPDATLTVS
jgi:uncharacterized protein involved in high-affinity Fe2+ transport